MTACCIGKCQQSILIQSMSTIKLLQNHNYDRFWKKQFSNWIIDFTPGPRQWANGGNWEEEVDESILRGGRGGVSHSKSVKLLKSSEGGKGSHSKSMKLSKSRVGSKRACEAPCLSSQYCSSTPSTSTWIRRIQYGIFIFAGAKRGRLCRGFLIPVCVCVGGSVPLEYHVVVIS